MELVALHEAACAAWSIKRYYDGWRPFSAIRYLGQLGQSSDPALPSYNAKGLPLVPGLIELVSTATAVSGGRHEGLEPGKVAVLSWPGQPPLPESTYQGVTWVYAAGWTTYQRTNFVTPAFPGYISGHSTFSRSAAEVMTAMTGTDFFPGGIGSFTITKLIHEQGPTAPVTLQWATYYDAADQVGLSRIWGGIHPPVDDFAGRRVGAECGKGIWRLATRFFDGSVAAGPPTLTIQRVGTNRHEVRHDAVRGLYYKLESSTSVDQGFDDESGGFAVAVETSLAVTNRSPSAGTKFYRVIMATKP